MHHMKNSKRIRNFNGLLKLANLNQTVGDFMHTWNADLNANPAIRFDAFNRINHSGIDVKQPSSRLPHILGGGLVGNVAANYLGANPFWKGVATIGGALYGNHMYNKSHSKDIEVSPGVVFRGF